MVAGPKVLKVVEEFKRNSILFDCDKMDEHHEDYPSFHKSTNDKIKSLHFVFKDHCNPFKEREEQGNELFSLHDHTSSSL